MGAIRWAVAIKKFRSLKGWKQHALGDILGVNQGRISAWEAEKSSPSDDVKQKLEGMFEIEGPLLDADERDRVAHESGCCIMIDKAGQVAAISPKAREIMAQLGIWNFTTESTTFGGTIVHIKLSGE